MTALRPISALLLGIGLLLVGHGITLTAVPLRASHEAFTALEIGLLGSTYYLGFIIGCLAAPLLILRAGHIRAFAAMVALTAASALVLPIVLGPLEWMALRAVTGMCLAGIYLVVESWLNDGATNQTRGFVFSSYVVVNFAAIGAGQLLVTTGSIDGFYLFALGSLWVVLAIIPVALTKSAQPAPIAIVRFRPRELYRRTPVGVLGVTFIGLATGSFWALAALFASGKGLKVDEAAIFMSIAVLGGAVIQWPVGRLSDRTDRRIVLLSILLAAALVGLLAAFLPLATDAFFILAFFLGGTLLPPYSIAVAHAFDHADRHSYVETSAGLLFANGIGAAVGPIAASLFMRWFGPGGLFVFTSLTQLLLAAFVILRLRRRGSPAQEEKVDFRLGSTAQIGSVLTPEPLDPNDPNVAVPPNLPQPITTENA